MEPQEPPLRSDPSAADPADGRRVAWVRGAWTAQDGALLPRDRAIEEHVRMLAGQQWCEWAPLLNEFVDLSEWQTDTERRRDRWPVINLCLPWFLTTHASLTENPPILTFEPGPDAVDAELAEVLDGAFKTLWRELGMADAWDRAAAWLVAAGAAYLYTWIDPAGGALRPWVGEAEVPVVDAYGQPVPGPDGAPQTQRMEAVPFGPDGSPRMAVGPDGPVTLGEPHAAPEGCLRVDVLSPLEVRGEWGPAPWHRKRWHLIRSYLSAEEVRDRWGAEVPATVSGAGLDGGLPYLKRLLFSAGHYDSASHPERLTGAQTAGQSYVELTTRWERGAPGAPGRLTVVTPDTVLWDGPAPRVPYTSPIREFGFIRSPGRVTATTPLEMLKPIQKAINRIWKQILEHGDRVTNPVGFVTRGSGLSDQDLAGMAPGDVYEVAPSPGGPPLQWAPPPPLSPDVYRNLSLLMNTFAQIGQLRGTEGAPPTASASGELVEELRFNRDRYLGPPMRGAVEEFGRLAEDWRALLPLIWTTERTISYAGEDNAVRVLTVAPHLWEQGRCNVVPDAESMLPQGRGEREARVYRMWQDGMFGVPPQSPQALRAYFAVARFPHLGRAMRPGGPDRVTAEHHLADLLRGAPATALPWFPWYDEAVHLAVYENFLKSPEYLKQPPPIQQQLARRWETLSQLAAERAARAAQMAAQLLPPGGPGGRAPGQPGPGPGAPPIPPPPAGVHAAASAPPLYPTDPVPMGAVP